MSTEENFNISPLALPMTRLKNGKINSVSRFVEKLSELNLILVSEVEDYRLFFRGMPIGSGSLCPQYTETIFLRMNIAFTEN